MLYETDDEKVEAIKKWWKENGLSVIAGAVIGLSVIYGWRYWVGYKEGQAAQASNAFEILLNESTQGTPETVSAQADTLRNEFGSTPYAALGSLVSAKTSYAAGKTEEAIGALESAISDAPDPALARIAALRLARIQVAEGKLDEAGKTIAKYDDSPSFAGDFAAVRGDLALARGDATTARTAYEEAIDKGTGLVELIRLKLDNLPRTDGPSQIDNTPAAG
ncbi:YfgM family protein [Imhoffiella purpurea]|uniref:Ancillary SecYEG translocon subunit n=1 Tax=Imhoffiella purpurea TaxID=1249627 RepID=W9VW00_9GAMM|nr:tetratricopeptide repeat protein [Imhoffiella purpurea]EXJ14645.1 hypothetical protein D779_2339 [Imhoffiella purpurea]